MSGGRPGANTSGSSGSGRRPVSITITGRRPVSITERPAFDTSSVPAAVSRTGLVPRVPATQIPRALPSRLPPQAPRPCTAPPPPRVRTQDEIDDAIFMRNLARGQPFAQWNNYQPPPPRPFYGMNPAAAAWGGPPPPPPLPANPIPRPPPLPANPIPFPPPFPAHLLPRPGQVTPVPAPLPANPPPPQRRNLDQQRPCTAPVQRRLQFDQEEQDPYQPPANPAAAAWGGPPPPPPFPQASPPPPQANSPPQPRQSPVQPANPPPPQGSIYQGYHQANRYYGRSYQEPAPVACGRRGRRYFSPPPTGPNTTQVEPNPRLDGVGSFSAYGASCGQQQPGRQNTSMYGQDPNCAVYPPYWQPYGEQYAPEDYPEDYMAQNGADVCAEDYNVQYGPEVRPDGYVSENYQELMGAVNANVGATVDNVPTRNSVRQPVYNHDPSGELDYPAPTVSSPVHAPRVLRPWQGLDESIIEQNTPPPALYRTPPEAYGLGPRNVSSGGNPNDSWNNDMNLQPPPYRGTVAGFPIRLLNIHGRIQANPSDFNNQSPQDVEALANVFTQLINTRLPTILEGLLQEGRFPFRSCNCPVGGPLAAIQDNQSRIEEANDDVFLSVEFGGDDCNDQQPIGQSSTTPSQYTQALSSQGSPPGPASSSRSSSRPSKSKSRGSAKRTTG